MPPNCEIATSTDVVVGDLLPEDFAGALARHASRLGSFVGRIRYFDEVTSTNDVVARLAETGATEGTTVVAAAQTAGRGRRGRSWLSPAGAGLYVSAVFRPPAIDLLTLMAGVALAEAVRRAAAVPAEIKWPNDLVVSRGRPWRKLGGILAEAVSVGNRVDYVILGFGINLRGAAYPPQVAARVTSLDEQAGLPVERSAVLVESLAGLAHWRAQLLEGRVDALLARWRALSPSSTGARVEIETGSGRQEGVAAGIDERGALLVRIGESVERVIAGEVTWL